MTSGGSGSTNCPHRSRRYDSDVDAQEGANRFRRSVRWKGEYSPRAAPPLRSFPGAPGERQDESKPGRRRRAVGQTRGRRRAFSLALDPFAWMTSTAHSGTSSWSGVLFNTEAFFTFTFRRRFWGMVRPMGWAALPSLGFWIGSPRLRDNLRGFLRARLTGFLVTLMPLASSFAWRSFARSLAFFSFSAALWRFRLCQSGSSPIHLPFLSGLSVKVMF